MCVANSAFLVPPKLRWSKSRTWRCGIISLMFSEQKDFLPCSALCMFQEIRTCSRKRKSLNFDNKLTCSIQPFLCVTRVLSSQHFLDPTLNLFFSDFYHFSSLWEVILSILAVMWHLHSESCSKLVTCSALQLYPVSSLSHMYEDWRGYDSPLLMQTSLRDLKLMLTNRLLANKLFRHCLYILWHADPSLRNDVEIKRLYNNPC